MPFMLIVSIYTHTQRYQWKTWDPTLSLSRLMADDWNERVLQMANSTLNFSLFSVILFYGLSFHFINLLAIILIRVTVKWQADAIAAVVAVVINVALAERKKRKKNNERRERKFRIWWYRVLIKMSYSPSFFSFFCSSPLLFMDLEKNGKLRNIKYTIDGEKKTRIINFHPQRWNCLRFY